MELQRAYPGTEIEFNSFVKKVRETAGYRDPIAFAIGTVERTVPSSPGAYVFEALNFKENFKAAAVIINVLGIPLEAHRFEPSHRQLEKMLSFFRAFDADGKKHLNIEALRIASDLAKKNEANLAANIFPVIVFLHEGFYFKDSAHTSLLDSLRNAGKVTVKTKR